MPRVRSETQSSRRPGGLPRFAHRNGHPWTRGHGGEWPEGCSARHTGIDTGTRWRDSGRPSRQWKRPHDPITDKTVFHACRLSARRAGIDHGADLPVVQRLLGHEDPRQTMIYLHLSTHALHAAPNPLETIRLTGDGKPAES